MAAGFSHIQSRSIEVCAPYFAIRARRNDTSPPVASGPPGSLPASRSVSSTARIAACGTGLGRRRPRRSYRRFCVLLAGVLAPLIGQIGLGAHSESAVAGSIVPSGRVAIRNMITAGYPADHILYYRGGMQVWRLLGLTVIGGE